MDINLMIIDRYLQPHNTYKQVFNSHNQHWHATIANTVHIYHTIIATETELNLPLGTLLDLTPIINKQLIIVKQISEFRYLCNDYDKLFTS